MDLCLNACLAARNQVSVSTNEDSPHPCEMKGLRLRDTFFCHFSDCYCSSVQFSCISSVQSHNLRIFFLSSERIPWTGVLILCFVARNRLPIALSPLSTNLVIDVFSFQKLFTVLSLLLFHDRLLCCYHHILLLNLTENQRFKNSLSGSPLGLNLQAGIFGSAISSHMTWDFSVTRQLPPERSVQYALWVALPETGQVPVELFCSQQKDKGNMQVYCNFSLHMRNNSCLCSSRRELKVKANSH